MLYGDAPMSDFLTKIKKPFQDKDYRHTYADGFLNSAIATQIKVLREQRHWSQNQLAQRASMQQARISVLENVNYSSWSLATLRRLAKAFDVRLKVTFETFGTILEDFDLLNRTSLERCSFANDPKFAPTQPVEEHLGEPLRRMTDDSKARRATQISDLSAPLRETLAGRRRVSEPPFISRRSAFEQLATGQGR